MRGKRRALFVLADGGRARFVERDPETRAFRTVREIDGAGPLAEAREARRRNPAVRSVQSATGASHTTGVEDPYRQAKAAFAVAIADSAVSALKSRDEHALILVAPARILAVLEDAIGDSAPVADTLDRDLTKARDIELERWLAPLERALNPVVPRG